LAGSNFAKLCIFAHVKLVEAIEEALITGIEAIRRVLYRQDKNSATLLVALPRKALDYLQHRIAAMGAEDCRKS
jgi:hypothetical protein